MVTLTTTFPLIHIHGQFVPLHNLQLQSMCKLHRTYTTITTVDIMETVIGCKIWLVMLESRYGWFSITPWEY